MTVTDVLRELNIDYREAGQSPHVTPGWCGLVCPWCGEGTGKYGLGINLQGWFASCWKCGSHPIAEVLASASQQPIGKIIELLKGIDRQHLKIERPTGRLVIPTGVGPLLPIHRRYLRGRGFDPDHLEQFWGVRGIGLASKLAWRVWLPIAHHGKTVSWTTRAIGGKGARYISAKPEEEAIRAKSLLWASDHARHAIIVVEGLMSVYRVGPGCVATGGVGWTKAQLLRMSAYPVRLVCLDNEPEAQRRARRLCDELGAFPGRTTNIVLDAKAPDEASERDVKLLRRMLR